VVDLIKTSGNSVTLKIVTVKSRSPSVNGTDHVDGQGNKYFRNVLVLLVYVWYFLFSLSIYRFGNTPSVS